MKKTLCILTLTVLCTLSARAVDLITLFGTWTEGTNSGPLRLTLLFTDAPRFEIERFTGLHPLTMVDHQFGRYLETKTGMRTFCVQSSTNGYTASGLNGVIKGTFKNFVTGATGTFLCTPTSPAL